MSISRNRGRIGRKALCVKVLQGFEARTSLLFEHDLFGKPVPTFPDHALAEMLVWKPFQRFKDHIKGAIPADINLPGFFKRFASGQGRPPIRCLPAISA
jgi:hypothetical protein